MENIMNIKVAIAVATLTVFVPAAASASDGAAANSRNASLQLASGDRSDASLFVNSFRSAPYDRQFSASSRPARPTNATENQRPRFVTSPRLLEAR